MNIKAQAARHEAQELHACFLAPFALYFESSIDAQPLPFHQAVSEFSIFPAPADHCAVHAVQVQ
jgi:hypothetical protein